MRVRQAVLGPGKDPRKLQRAWEFRRQMTPEERLLWQQLRGSRLSGLHFRRQCVLAGYIVDFYCHELGLVIEVDGAIHRSQQAEDQQRDAALTARDFRVLRVTNDEVRHNIEAVLRRMAEEAVRIPDEEQRGSGLPTSARCQQAGIAPPPVELDRPLRKGDARARPNSAPKDRPFPSREGVGG